MKVKFCHVSRPLSLYIHSYYLPYDFVNTVPNWSMAKTLISLVARKKPREVTSANVKNALRSCCGYSINESTLSEAISLCNSHGASNGNCWFDHVNDLTDQHRKLNLDL